MKESTFTQLAGVIEDKLGVPADEIHEDTVLEDISVDSLALIELTLVLQKHFGVSIASDRVSPEDTVGDLVAVVDVALRQAPATRQAS